jgi:hypothetical protein
MQISEDGMGYRILVKKLLMRAAWKFDGFADNAAPQQTVTPLFAAPPDLTCMK